MAAGQVQLHGLPPPGAQTRPHDPRHAEDLELADRVDRHALRQAAERAGAHALPRHHLRALLEARARHRGPGGRDGRAGRSRPRHRRLLAPASSASWAYQTPGHSRRRAAQRLGPGMADFSNLDKDGNIIAADDRVWFFKLADRLWHSDSSFRPVPAKYSLLSARILPSWGGNTDFADMRAAYDALDPRTKAEIEDLVCEHSLIHSR